jgi:type IV pilus assembly protein PilV
VRTRAHAQEGVTLIEVLVTLVVLLIGLIGLASVNSRSQVAQMESYQRVQAVILLQDMADRINANRKVASCYSNGANGMTLGTGSAAIAACTAGTAPQQSQAAADLAAWDALLKGSAETAGGSKVGAMIGAVGCVTLDDPLTSTYLVAVAWQGLAPTVAPTLASGTAFPCGNGAYGNEALHRVVTTKVRIGVLS